MTATGIVAMQVGHRPLGAERVEERPALERGQDLRGDAAADVHAGRGAGPQRQVAGFGAIGLDEHVERFHALLAPSVERRALIAAGRSIGLDVAADRRGRPRVRSCVPCVKRKRLTRPGPEITCSLSTRP